MHEKLKKIAMVLMSIEVLGVTFSPSFVGILANNVSQKEDTLIKQGIPRQRLLDLNPLGNQNHYKTLDTLQDSLNNRRFDSLDLRAKGKVPTKKLLDSMQDHYKILRF